jgi:hypothetical protein
MIINGGFLTMGTKRIGLARFEALLENLKRALALGTATISAASVEATTGGLTATAGGLLVTAGRIRSHLDHTSVNTQNHTLTAEQIYKGLITITSNTGAGNITTPTAAQIIGGHSGLGALTANGQTIICHVSNDGNQTLSVVAGASVTADVTRTCAAMTSLTLVFKRTSSTAVSCYVM